MNNTLNRGCSCAAKARIKQFNAAIDGAVARIREEWSIAGVFSWISIQLQKLRFNISLMSGSSGGCCNCATHNGGTDTECCTCCIHCPDPPCGGCLNCLNANANS